MRESVCPVCGCSQSLPDVRLAGRYRVGEACAGVQTGLVRAFDERGGRRVLLEIDAGGHREHFFRRAEALCSVADSPLLVPVLDAFDTKDGAVCVHAEPTGFPLTVRAFRPENEEFTQLLSAAADALLVLHSLRLSHGALTAESFYAAEDGALSLFVPAAAAAAEPQQDLLRLGEAFLTLHGCITRRQDTILSALCKGRYGTALELRHALSGLEIAQQ